MSTELKAGECICILTPHHTTGMEGYMIGDRYKYKYMERADGHKYYRVYLPAPYGDDPEWNYYETCGVGTFNRHFSTDLSQEGIRRAIDGSAMGTW